MARPSVSKDISKINHLFQCYDGYYDLPSWLDDCICGGSRVGHSNPASQFAIFNYLRFLPIIDLNTVTSFVNNKYKELFGRELSQRHCYAFMNRLLSTVSALEHQIYKRGIVIDSEGFYVSLEMKDTFVFADGLKINLTTGEYYV